MTPDMMCLMDMEGRRVAGTRVRTSEILTPEAEVFLGEVGCRPTDSNRLRPMLRRPARPSRYYGWPCNSCPQCAFHPIGLRETKQ